MISESNRWEYLEIKVDHNNLYSLPNGTQITLEYLGLNRWELVLQSPIVMHNMIEDPDISRYYFCYRASKDVPIEYISVPYYILIFKRPVGWVDL